MTEDSGKPETVLLTEGDTQTRPSKRGGYFGAHWRGEQPLSQSFWINLFLINFFLNLAIVAFAKMTAETNPVLTMQIFIITAAIYWYARPLLKAE